MSSFSRTQFPPGGWQFHQAVTGWSAPTPIASTFDQTVRLIIQHREKNPAICIRHGLSRDPVVVGNELENFTRLRCGIPMPTPTPPPVMMPGLPTGVVGTVDEIKRLAFGSSILIDWEESGELQVDQNVAEERAKVCASCPANNLQRYEEWLKHPLAGMLKHRIVRITAMHLKSQSDGKLGMCNALFAPTNILVHEPAAVLKKKIEQKGSVNVEDCCWLKKSA